MREEKEHACNGGTLRAGPFEDTERDAFSDKRNRIAYPADLQGVDSADVIDSEGIEEIASKGDAGIASREEKLHCSSVSEGAIQLWTVI